MNPFITTRFDRYQQHLIGSQGVSHYLVSKINVTHSDGRVRIRVALIDGGLLEFAEYIKVGPNDQIITHSYTFHWQDAHMQLVRRWDNVNHYPKLPHAPHHIHQADGTVWGNPSPPTLESVLAEIESFLIQ